MELYGFRSFTHGWQYVLTVMSPAGRTAALAQVSFDPDEIGVEQRPGHLTRYLEKREGGIDRLVSANRIRMLDRDAWNSTKQKLGNRILE